MHRLIAGCSALAVFALTAGAAVAKPMIYSCHNNSNSKTSFLQGEMVISYDADKDQVIVSDAAILAFQGKPLQGTVKSDNAKRIVFGWVLKDVVNSSGQATSLQYRGTYFKADGRFMLSVKPLGYDNSFDDTGSCTVK